MRIVIFDANNKRLGEKNITGTYWIVIDNGFSNDEEIVVAIDDNYKLPLNYELRNDLDDLITKSDITGIKRENWNRLTFMKGKLELIGPNK